MSDPKHQKILLVDDESDIREFISYNLSKEGYNVSTATNGKEAIQKAVDLKPHLIILDVMMPEMDGIETCSQLREIQELNSTIIAFLTARGEDYSQIAGFEAGGDDYITKPIKPKVLISRVKALLKRYKGIQETKNEGSTNTIEIAGLIIDKEKYVVLKGEEELILPRKEFELLALLASKKNKVFTRDEIYTSVWGDNIIVGDRTIDVHIRKLREKIGNDLIKTIKGVGYKFVD
ncbi:Alkaline phosphatase synthesis transcriptional regulatory protein PhoP [Salinivirga cyanobacteriivorans]|uniref:Phosphate regulon transcriptional regulatory protein PhoB n=1 Tax=Salinivirga cyanobacteriivorans TaxID=1307839 RepID=A0A0S2I309_9BACT|nr:response regulator transcription factor [Salinivirga cyanobacteriivorans]ALO16705.1 Alkaline phosphatase synthesis transcriptional regulatory protein PhoP [Salinivirga cyanobacteriivorans]